MKMPVLTHAIIDNSLLRKLTQPGNFGLYEKYVKSLQMHGYLNEETRLHLSPAGVLEFLGQKMPILGPADPTEYEKRALEILQQSPISPDAVMLLRTSLLQEFEAILRSQNAYSKSKMAEWIKKRKALTEPKLRGMIFDIIAENFTTNRGRTLLYRRVALDRTFLFSWPPDFERILFSTFLADLNYAYETGRSYGSTRGLALIWLDFEKKIRATAVDNKKTGPSSTITDKTGPDSEISNGLLKGNLNEVNSKLKFKAGGDFMDVEAIHFLCVGRFFKNECQPVLFSTQDAADDLLIRISLFKSLNNFAHQCSTGDNSTNAPGKAGLALQYDSDINIRFAIDIERVEPLLDILGKVKIKDWLKEKRGSFKV
jgi:hypothetical protein